MKYRLEIELDTEDDDIMLLKAHLHIRDLLNALTSIREKVRRWDKHGVLTEMPHEEISEFVRSEIQSIIYENDLEEF